MFTYADRENKRNLEHAPERVENHVYRWKDKEMTKTKLRKTLEALNISQAECARKTGYSEAAISMYLSGDRKIPKKFEISLNSLFTV